MQVSVVKHDLERNPDMPWGGKPNFTVECRSKPREVISRGMQACNNAFWAANSMEPHQ